MIGMHMRTNDRFDLKPVRLSDFDILTDLKLRIDDRGAALTPSTQKIGGTAGRR
jgi:hypothetical protein